GIVEALRGAGEVAARAQHARRDALGAVEPGALRIARLVGVGCQQRLVGVAALEQRQCRHRQRLLGVRVVLLAGDRREALAGVLLVALQVAAPRQLELGLAAAVAARRNRAVLLLRLLVLLLREQVLADRERRQRAKPVLRQFLAQRRRARSRLVVLAELV